MKQTPCYATIPLGMLDFSDKDLRIWVALCSFAAWQWKDGKPTVSQPGSCFPSLKRIAEMAHCSVDTVKRSLNHLEAAGYLVRQRRFRDNGGKDSNCYTLIANPKEVEVWNKNRMKLVKRMRTVRIQENINQTNGLNF